MIRVPRLICSKNSTHMASWQWVGSIFFICLEFGCELLMSTIPPTVPLAGLLWRNRLRAIFGFLTLVSLCHHSHWGAESSVLYTPPDRTGKEISRAPRFPSSASFPSPGLFHSWLFPHSFWTQSREPGMEWDRGRWSSHQRHCRVSFYRWGPKPSAKTGKLQGLRVLLLKLDPSHELFLVQELDFRMIWYCS